MKYLDIVIKIIFNTVKETCKFLMKTPLIVIEIFLICLVGWIACVAVYITLRYLLGPILGIN